MEGYSTHYLDKVIGDMNVIYIYKLIGKLTCTIFRIYYLDIAIDNGNVICKLATGTDPKKTWENPNGVSLLETIQTWLQKR